MDERLGRETALHMGGRCIGWIGVVSGYGATSNSMFEGPANIVYGSVSADAWVKLGAVASHSAAVVDNVGPYGTMPNDLGEWIVPAVDPISGVQPTSDTLPVLCALWTATRI